MLYKVLRFLVVILVRIHVNRVRLWESRNMNVYMYMCAHVYSVYL